MSPDLGPCCICERTGPSVCVLVSLPALAPIPGRGWGCIVCHQPSDGAMAVLCDHCADTLPDPVAALRFACRGYPGKDGRVPFADLHGTFGHDTTYHADEVE